jgi:hypothetical protein
VLLWGPELCQGRWLRQAGTGGPRRDRYVVSGRAQAPCEASTPKCPLRSHSVTSSSTGSMPACRARISCASPSVSTPANTRHPRSQSASVVARPMPARCARVVSTRTGRPRHAQASVSGPNAHLLAPPLSPPSRCCRQRGTRPLARASAREPAPARSRRGRRCCWERLRAAASCSCCLIPCSEMLQVRAVRASLDWPNGPALASLVFFGLVYVWCEIKAWREPYGCDAPRTCRPVLAVAAGDKPMSTSWMAHTVLTRVAREVDGTGRHKTAPAGARQHRCFEARAWNISAGAPHRPGPPSAPTARASRGLRSSRAPAA